MKLTFEGQTLIVIADQMAAMLIGLDHPSTQRVVLVDPEPEVEVEPKPEPKKRKSRAKPKPATEDADILAAAAEPVPEPEQDVSVEDCKKEAIAILMELYNDGKKDEVKALLEAFGVKKFGEIPDEKGPDLLEAANKLKEA